MTRGIESTTRKVLASTLMAGWLVVVLAAPSPGQVGVAGGECPAGLVRQGDVGISSFECSNCRLSDSGAERVWNFSSEPIVRAVSPGSPADGRVRAGDAIVAVDGHLITTGEGGRRLANLEPGQRVSLVVRTGNRERTVEMTAGSKCRRSGAYAAAPALAAEPAEPSAPVEAAVPSAEAVVSSGVGQAVPRAAVAPVAEAAPPAGVLAVGPVPRPTYTLLPSGWFGFGIQCTNCRWTVEDETGRSEWEFREPPEISSVQEGSPAAAAGLRRGDVLTEIDGEPLVSREGGRRFGSVEPGQTVRWTYQRGGQTRETRAKAGRRPEPPIPPEAEPMAYSGEVARAYVSPDVSRLRYAGLVGKTSVEVRGAGSVVVNIIEPGREIEIVTSDSRTRIRLDDSR